VPFSGGPPVQAELGSALSGRVGIGETAYLALKRQANQISPFQGAGGDKPHPYIRNRRSTRVSNPGWINHALPWRPETWIQPIHAGEDDRRRC